MGALNATLRTADNDWELYPWFSLSGVFGTADYAATIAELRARGNAAWG